MRLLDPPVRPQTSRTPRRANAPFDAVLTTEGKALLEQKAEELRSVTLPALLQAVTEDRHDELTRLAYEDTVVELRRVESVLAHARPIPTQRAAADQVSLGDRITVAFLQPSDGDVETTEKFLLVHPFEAPLDQHRISVMSPLGRAVLGRQVGEVVTFDAPTQRRSVRIVDRVPAG